MARPRGYILPMTLALVAIAALVLARVCREHMRRSLRAARDTDELQRRWGMLSCQATYLRQAEAILESSELAAGRATAAVQTGVNLGGQQFELRFADDSAKLNLNAVYRRSDIASVERLARDGARRSGTSLAVHLRPMNRGAKSAADEDPPPAFGSFGQIFDESGIPSAAAIELATRDVTCWGDGKLNWRRASAAALAEALHGDRQSAARILALQKRGAAANAQELRQALGTAPDAAKNADDLFIDSSTAQSLWVTCGDPQSPAARFAVRRTQDHGRASVTSFTWQP